MKASKLFKALLKHFNSTRKTGWGKNEVCNVIKEIYIKLLEEDKGG